VRHLGLLLVLCPTAAGAEIRLDLAPIPELSLLEPAFHVDRDEDRDERSKSGILGSIGVGYGRFDDDDRATTVGTLAVGKRTERMVALASSELVVAGRDLFRGHHRGLIELRTEEDHEGGIGGAVTLQTAIDHGEARGLAPVKLGPGRHDTAGVGAEALLDLGAEKDDFVWVAELFADGGATRWHDTPEVDRAYRRSLGLGFGRRPADGELPRGAIDLIRGRVEHVTIERPITAAAAGRIGDTDVRIVELGLGAHDLTLLIDRELLAVISADIGWSWLEADTASGRLEDNMFRMRLATAMKWQTRHHAGERRLGVAIAREPGYTANGQRLVTDWRAELEYGLEDHKYVLSASGGISWIRAIEGGQPAPMLTRYGSHVEAFYKLGRGIELGGYHAASYEPRLGGDPWASPRHWGTELGALVRWRSPAKARRAPVHFQCGGTGEEPTPTIMPDNPEAPPATPDASDAADPSDAQTQVIGT